MDLREYDYISKRPDTFQLSTLKAIRALLERAQFLNSVARIDSIIKSGYITPPPDYEWHGCYQVSLPAEEQQAIISDLQAVHQKIGLSAEEANNLPQYIKFFTRCLLERPVSYAEHQAEYPALDLRNISLDGLKRLIFSPNPDDALPQDQQIQKYIRTWTYGDPEYISRLYMQLFKESEGLLEEYTEAELEQGLWKIMSSGLHGFTAYDLIWEEKPSIATKEALIESMYFLYGGLFIKNPLIQACHMWWDSFAYSFFRIDPAANEAHRRIQEAMFSALQKILTLDSQECQAAALHGLGHLRHPDTAIAINTYLDRNRGSLSEEIERYAKVCMTGKVM